jgi:hypothetical protein
MPTDSASRSDSAAAASSPWLGVAAVVAWFGDLRLSTGV